MNALAEKVKSGSSLWLDLLERVEGLEEVHDCHNLLHKQLGRGHFSWVFACPWDDSLAIKIGAGPNKQGDIYDDGWLHYAAFCMDKRSKGDDNPLLMDVHTIHIGRNRRWFAALIERYDCTIDEWALRYPGGWKDHTHPVRAKHETIRMILKGRGGIKAFCPEYLQYAAQLRIDEEFLVNDLHDANVMVKGTRIIITDPYGGGDYSRSTKAIEKLQRLGILPKGEYMRRPHFERTIGLRPGNLELVAGRPRAHVEEMHGRIDMEEFARVQQMVMEDKMKDAFVNLGAFGNAFIKIDDADFEAARAWAAGKAPQWLGFDEVHKEPKKPKQELKGWKKNMGHLKGINDQPKPRRK